MNVHELETVRTTLEELIGIIGHDDPVLEDLDVDASLKLLSEEIENASKEEGAQAPVEADEEHVAE